MTLEYLDRPEPGWFLLDVMREESRKSGWVALMIDVDPEDLQNCTCDFPALFFVHPNDYRPGARVAHQRWLHIHGKHRNWESAWAALEDMISAVAH
jgi:hypothetical protein